MGMCRRFRYSFHPFDMVLGRIFGAFSIVLGYKIANFGIDLDQNLRKSG